MDNSINKSNLRKTHPNLYRMIMVSAVGSVLLGINFFVFTPTFLVYDLPNEVWGTCFLVLGLGKMFLLNTWRSLRLLRMTMAAMLAYILFFLWGTSEPLRDGTGSAQLPIVYLIWAAFQLPLLLEPFANPLKATEQKDD